MKEKICVLGLGYIGLPTAAMFASNGFDIIGVDVNEKVVNALNKGEIIIEEPYLDVMVRDVVVSGKLKASVKPEVSDVYIIAVPTPINEDKTADMSYVISATRSIVPLVKKGDIIILESTSPPKTVEDIIVPILKESSLNVEEDLYIAHSPERVIPGKILFELVENNRIVGGIDEESALKVKKLYQSFVKGEIYTTNATTAEMCKLTENTFRDVNIALANELAMICEQMNINVWDVIKFSNKHPRVNLHQPGPGVGGHCIAVDPWFIVEKFPETAKMITLSRTINDSMPEYVFNKSRKILGTLKDKKVTILGITYKPDVDDMRESPIIELIELLEEVSGITISIHDPYVQDFKYLEKDIYTACKDSDLVILGVNHKLFSDANMDRIYKDMKQANILDTRNFFDEKALVGIGFNYNLLGKGK
ncbi:nucleotide sugar dehydrogenase [Vallitalea guaymasensis]|uniref:Nucleotide sugar dehydrogenase n=1 Tax=Vallitalea guaymasensis TaxID=1185412 RepID=A0A8J8MCG6_9FIRM|nr:nucleotide sugar dehydrogenase [Vallitalea guaymasensis]QUH30140.1 nucleotide sugar dehydrogenase [Vallitalea guaymasensis]